MKPLALFLCYAAGAVGAESSSVGPVPDALRAERSLAPFYQKHLAVGSLPILGSAKVSDAALAEAAWIVRHMLANRPDVLAALTKNGVRVAVMAYNEYTTDLPEQRDMQPRVFWDRRARGLGGLLVSCGEENLLCFPGDPYAAENLLVHEFAHVLHGEGLTKLDTTFKRRLNAVYDNARRRGLWPNTYAITNAGEYWAEGVQSWFDCNRQNDALHCHVDTRPELEEYDPDLSRFIAEALGKDEWRYRKPADRPAAERAHLGGFDPAKAPRFRWREEPLPEKPRVLIQTAMGDIEVELFARQAPLSTANFLKYVHEGFYSNGSFFRTVTPANQPTDKVKIQVVQIEANPAKEKEFFPAIALERTRDTGLRHEDGTLSMARAEPDSAQDSFSICIGAQPELDFGGARNPDGQGFAAFGKVVKGMDVVRKIHASPAEGQKLTPPVLLQRAIRLN